MRMKHSYVGKLAAGECQKSVVWRVGMVTEKEVKH
jgi:hypothetical protein